MDTAPAARFVGGRLRDVKHRRFIVAASKLEPFLYSAFVLEAIKGHAMITMGIGLAAGVFYWLSSYQIAFWILVYAIVYGGLSVLRGDSQSQLVYRRGSGLTTAILIPVAWHIGGLAGYL